MNRVHWVLVGMIALCASTASLHSQSNPAAVETTKVVARTLQKTVTIPGDLAPFQGVNLNARVPGFVESVAVDRGSWVKRGQRLATILAPELRAQRAEAEAKLQAVRAQEAEAQARLVAAQSTYDRLKAASATPGVVAGNDLGGWNRLVLAVSDLPSVVAAMKDRGLQFRSDIVVGPGGRQIQPLDPGSLSSACAFPRKRVAQPDYQPILSDGVGTCRVYGVFSRVTDRNEKAEP